MSESENTRSVPVHGVYDPCMICWYPAQVIINGERQSPPGGVTVSGGGLNPVRIMPHSADCADAYGSQVPEAARQIERYAGQFLWSTYDYDARKHGTITPTVESLASILSVLPRPPHPDQYAAIQARIIERRAEPGVDE